MLKLLFILINIFLTKSLTPLSECTQGRIAGYDEYEKGGSCDFGVPKMYGGAPNEAFYNNGEQCGICYEMVGPTGVLYFMVDSYCPVEGFEEVCGGDMLHFDMHKNGFKTIVDDDDLGKLNVTFRMVACDHKGNITIRTIEQCSEYYFEFVAMNHVIGLKKVYYSYDKNNWTGLNRLSVYNHWLIGKIDKLPFYLQFEAISGEKVITTIETIKADYTYDTGVQFTVPKDMYFSVDNLKQVINPKKEECCKLDDAFTNVYNEGNYFGEWFNYTNCKMNIHNNAGCKEGSNKCIRIEFENWSYFQIKNRMMIDSKRYKGIELYIKSENECNNCLRIELEEKEALVSTKKAGVWEKVVVNFADFGFEEDKFYNFIFQGKIPDKQIFYFDDINLVKSDYIDDGICYSNSPSPSPSKPPSDGNTGTTVLVVFIIILVIAGVAIGGFWYFRYKRNNTNANLENITPKSKLLH